MRIPLFPIGTVMTPGMVIPLHIFEPRYRLLVDVLQELPVEQRTFGMVAIRFGHEVGGRPDVYGVGTEVLADVERTTNDGIDLLVIGTRRFQIHHIDYTLPYDQADVTYLPESDGAGAVKLQQLTALVRDKHKAYRKALEGLGVAPVDGAEVRLPDEPGSLSHAVSAMTVLDLPTRQSLLEKATIMDRLIAEFELLQREIPLVSGMSTIPATNNSMRTGESLN